MMASISPTILNRLKSWQLVCLGVSGWLTLYSAAMINWSNCRFWVGNSQGGCFAMVMTLAGVEARRFRRSSEKNAISNNFAWTNGLTAAEINFNLAQMIQRQEFRVEEPSQTEKQAGFGVRAVNAGRTIVFETKRWDENIIDLEHALSTEKNRRNVLANLAVIVGVGKPSEEVAAFIKKHPIQLLVEDEFKSMMESERSTSRV